MDKAIQLQVGEVVRQAKEISDIFNTETRPRNYKKLLLEGFGADLGNIAISLLELEVIPDQNKYLFLHHLIQLIDMYRLNVQSDESETVYRNVNSSYFDKVKEQIKSSEAVICKQTNPELIEALNIFIEKSKTSLNTWAPKPLKVGRQVESLRYELELSFISVRNAYASCKKMSVKELEFAALFFCNLGHGSKDEGNLIPNDAEYMRDRFKAAKNIISEISPFYRIVKGK